MICYLCVWLLASGRNGGRLQLSHFFQTHRPALIVRFARGQPHHHGCPSIRAVYRRRLIFNTASTNACISRTKLSV